MWSTITREQNNLNTLRFSWKCLWVSRAIKKIEFDPPNRTKKKIEAMNVVYASQIAFKVWITWSRCTVVKNLAHFVTLQSSWVSKNQLIMWLHKSILPALLAERTGVELLVATGRSLGVTTSERHAVKWKQQRFGKYFFTERAAKKKNCRLFSMEKRCFCSSLNWFTIRLR